MIFVAFRSIYKYTYTSVMAKSLRQNSSIPDFQLILSKSRNVLVISGAGMSAESGVPTFRGDGGFWRNYKSQDLATPYAFYDDPGLVWEFYHYRRELVRKVEPNPGHYCLAEAEKRFTADRRSFTVITQNVDGLHTRCGSTNVIELHGNLFKTRCTSCHHVQLNTDSPICPSLATRGHNPHHGVIWRVENVGESTLNSPHSSGESRKQSTSVVEWCYMHPSSSNLAPIFDPKLHTPIPEDDLPHCGQPTGSSSTKLCNGLLRPHVVWFGESLEKDILRRVDIAMASADVCLVVGTSSVVYPAANFAPDLARRGVPVAEINIDSNPATNSLRVLNAMSVLRRTQWFLHSSRKSNP